MTNSTNSFTEVNGVQVLSDDSSDDSSISLSHNYRRHYGYKSHYHHTESRYSHSNSSFSYSAYSFSRGSSNSSKASTVSTQSFIPKSYRNFFEDANSNETSQIELKTVSSD